jgi:hypothetical protein
LVVSPQTIKQAALMPIPERFSRKASQPFHHGSSCGTNSDEAARFPQVSIVKEGDVGCAPVSGDWAEVARNCSTKEDSVTSARSSHNRQSC